MRRALKEHALAADEICRESERNAARSGRDVRGRARGAAGAAAPHALRRHAAHRAVARLGIGSGRICVRILGDSPRSTRAFCRRRCVVLLVLVERGVDGELRASVLRERGEEEECARKAAVLLDKRRG
jgi:hypothetical protein